MWTICKQFRFEAAHFLTGVPSDHQCHNLHGHSYRVEIMLQSERLDDRGFVLDFGELAQFRAYLQDHLDHSLLNDLFPNPTAEIVSRHLYDIAAKIWSQVISVRVWETETAYAEYQPQSGDSVEIPGV